MQAIEAFPKESLTSVPVTITVDGEEIVVPDGSVLPSSPTRLQEPVLT